MKVISEPQKNFQSLQQPKIIDWDPKRPKKTVKLNSK